MTFTIKESIDIAESQENEHEYNYLASNFFFRVSLTRRTTYAPSQICEIYFQKLTLEAKVTAHI